VQGVLDGLTSAGLFATPAFALLAWDDAPGRGFTGRVIVRGAVVLRLIGENEEVECSGLDVSTWHERSFTDVTAITVHCGDGDHLLSAFPSLPLAVGMVRARRLSMVASRVGSRAASSTATVPVTERAATILASPEVAPVEVKFPELKLSEVKFSEETISDQTVAADAVVAGYDHLFGATMMRGVEQAAVRPADEAEPDVVAQPDINDAPVDPGRHDGLTVLSGDIRKLRDSRRVPRPLPDAAAATLPSLYLLLPSGVREPLGQPIVVGRAPGVNKVSGGQVPRLVSLGGADQDISRNHVRFAVEGDTVVVTDLHSRNGTLIVLPGKPPQKLRGGESTSVIVGTVVDLGNGVTLAVCQGRDDR